MRKLILGVAALTTGVGSLHAATLFNDTFTDGTRSGYYLARGTSTVTVNVANDAVINTGNAIAVDSTTTTQRPIAKTFTDTTLAAGDSLSVAFDFRITNSPVPDTDRKFRFGLFNNAGSPVTADTSSTTTTNGHFGYIAELDTGADPANTSYASLFGISPGTLLGGTATSLGATSSNGGFSTTDNAKHHGVITITHDDSNQLLVTLNYDSLTLTGTATTPSTYTFNEFVIGENGAILGFAMDNVVATYTPASTPEPASLGLLGLAGLALKRRQRA